MKISKLIYSQIKVQILKLSKLTIKKILLVVIVKLIFSKTLKIIKEKKNYNRFLKS